MKIAEAHSSLPWLTSQTCDEQKLYWDRIRPTWHSYIVGVKHVQNIFYISKQSHLYVFFSLKSDIDIACIHYLRPYLIWILTLSVHDQRESRMDFSCKELKHASCARAFAEQPNDTWLKPHNGRCFEKHSEGRTQPVKTH